VSGVVFFFLFFFVGWLPTKASSLSTPAQFFPPLFFLPGRDRLQWKWSVSSDNPGDLYGFFSEIFSSTQFFLAPRSSYRGGTVFFFSEVDWFLPYQAFFEFVIAAPFDHPGRCLAANHLYSPHHLPLLAATFSPSSFPRKVRRLQDSMKQAVVILAPGAVRTLPLLVAPDCLFFSPNPFMLEDSFCEIDGALSKSRTLLLRTFLSYSGVPSFLPRLCPSRGEIDVGDRSVAPRSTLFRVVL